jgi:iron complex outermembrane recepter protein
MNRTNSFLTAVSLSALSLALTVPAFAQDGSEENGEIIVTAERRAANIQDVPVAVSAFTQDSVEALGVTDTLSLARFVPSMVGANNTGIGSANAFFIRGLGNTESIATFDPPVGTYVDDIYVARQNANNYQFLDVERIEVLRGPQGTLFGRNTTGGAINVILRKPGDELKGFIEVGAGSFEQRMARGSVDLPLTDWLQTKLSFYGNTDEGYMEGITTGETYGGKDQWGARIDLRFLPTEAITWDVGIERIYDSGSNLANSDRVTTGGGFTLPSYQVRNSRGQLVINPSTGTPFTATTSTQPLFYQTRTGIREGGCNGDLAASLWQDNQGNCSVSETTAITSNLQWDLSFLTANYIAGYRDLTQDFSLEFFDGPAGLFAGAPTAGQFVILNNGRHKQLSHEFKLAGETFNDRLSWVAGAYYLDENNETQITDYLGIAGGLFTPRRLLNNTYTLAFYAQGDFNITDNLVVTLGARYTDETKTLRFVQPRGINPRTGLPFSTTLTTAALQAVTSVTLPNGQVLAFPNGIPTKLSEEKVTPRIAVRYDVSDDINVFASATQGFKSGGWNARETQARLVLPFSPEEVWSYELGVRSQFFDRRVTLNATAYQSITDNLQTPSAVTNNTGGVSFITQNSGDLEVRGLEVEGSARATSWLDLFATLSLMDAEYTRAADPAGRIDIGDEPVRTPDLQANLGGRFFWEIGGHSVIRANATASYISEYWVSTNNEQPVALTGDYWTANLGLAYEPTDAGWSVRLDCTNCTEEEAVATWLFYTYPIEPRRITFRLKTEF